MSENLPIEELDLSVRQYNYLQQDLIIHICCLIKELLKKFRFEIESDIIVDHVVDMMIDQQKRNEG